MSRAFRAAEARRRQEREQARAEARQAEAREKALEEARERRREEEREEEKRAAARQDELDRAEAERRAQERSQRLRAGLRDRRRAEAVGQARRARSEDRVREALREQRRESEREAARQAERDAEREATRRAELRAEAVATRRDDREGAAGAGPDAAGRGEDERRAERRAERQGEQRSERRGEQRRAEQRAEQRGEQRRTEQQGARRDERAAERRDTDGAARRAEERRADERVAGQQAARRDEQEAARRDDRTAQRRSAEREAERAAERAEQRRERLRAEQTGRRQAEHRAARTRAPRRSAQRIPTGVLSGSLPWLSVADGLLVDEAAEAVTLRGVAVRGFARAHATGGEYAPPLSESDAATMADWGFTAVGVGIAGDLAVEGGADATAEAYLQALDAAVATAATAGLYAVVELSLLSAHLPTAPGEGADSFDPPLPDPAALDVWGVLARRYADEPAVLFQVFRPPHDPAPGDTTDTLLPRVQPSKWSEWALASLSALRREHPRSLVVVPGAARGGDLSAFPLVRSDGSEPANVVYAATLDGADGAGGAANGAGGDPPAGPDTPDGAGRRWVELDRLGRTHAVGVVGWSPGSEPDALPAVVSTGRRLARAGWHWMIDGWRDGSAARVAERGGRLQPTPLGRAVQVAAAAPPAPAANLDPALRAQHGRCPTDVNRPMAGRPSLGRRPRRPARPPRPPTTAGARVSHPDRTPFVGLAVRVILPSGPHAGTAASTDPTGFVPVPTPGPGLSLVGSADWELMPAAAAAQDYAPVEVVAGTPTPDPTYDVPVPPRTVVDLVARRAFYLVCPQCGLTYKTVEPAAGGTRSACPRDGFDLSTLEAAVTAAPGSFSTPVTGQNPAATPTALRARGTSTLATAHGTVTVYWDESRFLHPASGDYRLWGSTRTGVKTVDVIGRTTWGAAAPVSGRSWEFHEAPTGASPPYATSGVPSSENRQLATVFRWMTVHHTTDTGAAAFSTAVDVRAKQTGPPQNFADVGYHYVIDTNGAIYEGRPLGIEGQHVELFNAANLGIVVAGDFESRPANLFSPDTPTTAQLSALDDLVDVLAARFGIRSVWTHLERKLQSGAGATECPGAELIPHVVTVLRPAFPGPPP